MKIFVELLGKFSLMCGVVATWPVLIDWIGFMLLIHFTAPELVCELGLGD
jgi:hypothetical protein